MGGKTKHTQRTKNNTKPSSSARSAELLANTSTFVGYSTHSDLGIIQLIPGFTTVEQMPESNANPQYLLTMKKFSKKDPMTKKKALLEFIDLVNGSDLNELKMILPMWPKFYQNLATDPEHNVRELSQTVLQLLMSKCKKAVAPYLKQLVPVWLASQFDNYAPAASIASASFRETFASNNNRTREVCIHCQNEIMEYVTCNLTIQTASTLSVGKNLTPEEAEQKYQRVIMCSLKELSFFVEHTLEAEEQSQIHEGLKKLMNHQKFWSFAKNKCAAIRAAWFELIYNILQYPKQQDIFASQKSQLIAIAFENIDESDPLVAPHIWGGILLIQRSYKDWYENIDFEKKIFPKFNNLLLNAFNRNAQAICPHILPFFSQLSEITTFIGEYHVIVKQFFDNIKNVIISGNCANIMSKQDNKIIIKTYFECLRYLMQKIHTKSGNTEDDDKTLVSKLLEENIIEPIKCCFTNKELYTVKCFFQHTSTLLAFLDKNSALSPLYQKLLETFWSLLFDIIPNGLKSQDVNQLYLERVIELINALYVANPNLEEHNVKFVENAEVVEKTDRLGTSKVQLNAATFTEKELKELVLQLLRICISRTTDLKSTEYIKNIRFLCNMFNDIDFFAKISEDGQLDTTLKTFISLLKPTLLHNEDCEIVVEILFEILQHYDKQQKFQIIEEELIQIPHHLTQTLVLQRLLSHPMCMESEVRNILCRSETSEIISKIALDVVTNNSNELFNMLHKCFFETDSGEILISSKAVDSILNIISEPLITRQDNENIGADVDACGSFIAQIMPVVCSNDNSTPAVKHKVFLRLFKFSLEKCVSDDDVTPDTIWEITTCWQDALSSKDIIIEEDLLYNCADIVDLQVIREDLSISNIDSMAELMAKFVTCSTENIEEEKERSLKVDETLKALLRNNSKDIQDVYNVCVFIEALKDVSSPTSGFTNNTKKFCDLKFVLKRCLLNFSALCKLVCKPTKTVNVTETAISNEDEVTEDYCDPNENLLKIWSDYLQTQFLQYISIAACADTLITYTDKLENDLEIVCLEFSEKVQLLLRQSGELSVTLKERLLKESAKEENIIHCRSLPYLVNIEQYAQFEESATLLLAEDLQEILVTQKAYKAYINTLQYLLPKLEAKTIGIQCPIMRCDPSEIWIKAAIFRCLIQNNFSSSYNNKLEQNIVTSTVQFISEHKEKLYNQKDLLLFQTDVTKLEMVNILNGVEYMKLLIEVLRKIPYQLTLKNWDIIHIGLGHWILSLTKTLDYALQQHSDQKSLYFILHVYKLFAALTDFFAEEKQKSSTKLVKDVYDEWMELFSRDVYLTLFKSFYRICQHHDISVEFSDCWKIFLNELTATMENLDYGVIYAFCKKNNQISLDDVCKFLLENISSPIHSLRTLSIFIMRQLIPHFVADDIEMYDKISEEIEKDEPKSKNWHFLNRFQEYIERYDLPIQNYLKEFSFKLTEISEMKTIERHEAFSYLMLWDCIIYVCAKSPVALRSVYTSWLHENKYEEDLLHFLFRAMPAEILKNHSMKQLNNEIFKRLSWLQIKDPNLPLEKYACHMYTEVLSKLPAVVRKWWSTSPSRQKTFVDTLTTNFVSPILCQKELSAIASKKERHENMQVTVHVSSREVLAVYSIDEARMELVITLATNYPLGSVKVDCNKQIGGRSSSRNVAMQLTIFLTHQNGTIFDGLTLWKNNLDKKFEGVEECYVCYTVIHQDTCQLPKLTCKTCKKKFHGPCLYKWFTTSSKSTCPICRNVF